VLSALILTKRRFSMMERASVYASSLLIPAYTSASQWAKTTAPIIQSALPCATSIFLLLIRSSQNNSLLWYTITIATTLPESTTKNEEMFSLITEAWLPENHNVGYDVTSIASKSSISLSCSSSCLVCLEVETTCVV